VTETPSTRTVSIAQIVRAFLWIAMSSFGSSQSAAIQREVVRIRQWLTVEEITTMRGLALIAPGANSPNLAMLIGQRLAGTPGAIAAYLSASVPGLVITLILGALSLDPHLHGVSAGLRGAAAASVGLLCSNAIELTGAYRTKPLVLCLTVATLLAVVVLHFSLWLTLTVFLPLSILLRRHP
jgi:chromate transporter